MAELPRRPGPTVRTRVTEHAHGSSRVRQDRLPTEEPLEIRLAAPGVPAHRAWVTMRTPGHDFELAAGFCLHEGIAGPSGIRRVAYCTDADLAPDQEFNVVTVTLEDPTALLDRPGGERHVAHSQGSSACGVCGKDSIADALAVPRGASVDHDAPDLAVVHRLPGQLRRQQTVFDRTGGVHGAGLADANGGLLVVREDIGRHNAVDKVVGARVLAGETPGAAYLVVSGRAGFELVQKAVTAGIGVMVAVGAPSSLAVGLARDAGMALFGFTDPDRAVQYA